MQTLEHLDWVDDMTALCYTTSWELAGVQKWTQDRGAECKRRRLSTGVTALLYRQEDHLLHQLSLTLPLADFLSATEKMT